MLVLAILFGQYVFWNKIGVSGLFGAKVDRVVSASFAWYCFVSLPVYQFLVLRWLYRWLLWSITLIGFSKSSVNAISTHPDQSGGLAATAEPVAGFAVFLSAVNVVVATAWGDEILRRGRDLASYAATFACLALVSALLALAPLLSFSQNLVRTRLEGLRQYGKLAYDYSRRFHDRWIVDGNEDALLGTADIQSLADLGNTYERVARMRPVPFGLQAAIWIAAATAGPVVPLLATKFPINELFSHLVTTMLGF
jgi:hypothetical protein